MALGPARPSRSLAADTLQARRVLGHVSLNLYYPAHQPAPRVPQDLAGRRLILISGYSYWKPVTDFIQDPNLHLRLYRTGTHHAALRMLELGRGDYLLDYQAPVEAASRQALASQELYRLPLRMIVSRHIPGAEALRDRLTRPTTSCGATAPTCPCCEPTPEEEPMHTAIPAARSTANSPPCADRSASRC